MPPSDEMHPDPYGHTESPCSEIDVWSPTPHILNLPSDLIFGIYAELDEASRVSFALCCKALFYITFESSVRDLKALLDEAEKQDRELSRSPWAMPGLGAVGSYVDSLMPYLERHLTGCYYCAYCYMFHPFASIVRPRRWYKQRIKFHCWAALLDRPRPIFDQKKISRIGYHHGRLAMNRYYFGPSVGVPLEFLKSKKTIRYNVPFRDRAHWARSCEYRISQGELVLRIKLVLKSSYRPTLLNILDTEDFDFCCHVTTANRAFEDTGPRTRIAPLDILDFTLREHNCWSYCSKCVSDYHVSFEAEPCKSTTRPRTNYSVTINGFHLLGAFRHPLDMKWRSFIGYRNKLSDWDGAPWDLRFDSVASEHIRDMNQYPCERIHLRWITAEAA